MNKICSALHFAITPLIGAQLGYHYAEVTSDMASDHYNRNRVFGGLNVTFW